MEENKTLLVSSCNFKDVRPIMMALPYPAIQVKEKNPVYANLLSVDYCGAVSELSAITQYINNENRLSVEHCPLAGTILGIAIAEMIHLQRLGELICLLGGKVDFTARLRDGRPRMWTPEYLNLQDNVRGILTAAVESEKAAINQYRMHSRMIRDEHICAVLARIVQDEQYHIMVLQALMKS